MGARRFRGHEHVPEAAKEAAQLSKQAACRCIAIVDVASEFGRQSAPPREAVPADPASIIDYMGSGSL